VTVKSRKTKRQPAKKTSPGGTERELAALHRRIAELETREREREQSEASLRETLAIYRNFINASPDAVGLLDISGTLLQFSRSGLEMLGMSDPADLVGRKWLEFVAPEHHEKAVTRMQKALTDRRERLSNEYILVRQDGTRITAEVNAAVMKDARGQPVGFLCTARDITDRKHLEKELLNIGVREQRRIGQDLHDGLGQHLTGIAMMCKALENKLLSLSRPEAKEARRIGRLVSQAITQAGNLARGLCPVGLGAHGLSSALKEMALSVENVFGIPCRFTSFESVVLGDDATANHLYYIAQEAVSNAIRHARATRISIRLSAHNHHINLTVRDNGRGLPSPLPEAVGMGINLMKYRIQMIDGVLDFKSAPRGGTSVVCKIPRTSPDG